MRFRLPQGRPPIEEPGSRILRSGDLGHGSEPPPAGEDRQWRREGSGGQAPDSLEVLHEATVMMVDDDPFSLEVMREFLDDAGYRSIVAVADPNQALERIRAERPDVVLLDLMMPGVSGFDILRTLRADDGLRYTPAIMLTAANDAETKLQALELGATDFLAKPVDPSELKLRLRNTLAFKAYRTRLEYYDGLTGLPNRLHFLNSLGQALSALKGSQGRLAVLHIDIDRFKQINDTLGYEIGDLVIKAVANRFENVLKRFESPAASGRAGRIVVSRYGGDEFNVLLPTVADAATPDRLAWRLLGTLAEPFRVGRHEFFVTASIGIAIAPDHGEELMTLLGGAEVAMHAAKTEGRNTCKSYAPELNALAMERLTLETDLRLAIERRELVLHYQPQVSAATNAIIGVEALMRWRHPKFGLLMPDRFIPLAEEAGLIDELGEWTLFEACRQGQAWADSGWAEPMISVNVAASQLRTPGFVSTVRTALAASGLPPACLTLEITESMLMSNAEQVLDRLRQIRDLGVRLSLDDFGTGYSSFSYLKRLPIDEIKIDRSFIVDLMSSPPSAAIVGAIVTLADGLGLATVIEGVETAEQLDRLTALGCRVYQGFLFSAAVPAEKIMAMLRG